MLGGDAGAMIGRPLHDLVHAESAERAPGHGHSDCPLHVALRDGIAASAEEELFSRPDGVEFPVAYNLTPMREGGALAGAVLTFRDVTERRRFERQLRHFADHDPLTDLFNRRRFEEEIGRHTARVARRGGSGSVLLIDIDNFKYANDTLGHRAGDEILRKVAGLLRDRLRSTDVLARLGADEFAVLLADAADAEAVNVANELARIIREQRFSFDGRSLQMTASVGITPVSGADLTPEELMVRADIAMYQAKEGGRDRISIYTPETAVATRERIGLTWVERIRKALAEDRFVLFGQPIYDVAAKRVSQVELLLRMRGDDDDELIAPGNFLPTAERFGLIQQIDAWVVREAIGCLERISAGGKPIALEINLSGLSIGDPELPRLIESELEGAAIDPGDLVFEITETAAIASMDEARTFAESLTRLGCRFALDDFGAGFGSFFYLKYLPLDYLKIDGEFIQNLPRSSVDQRMVRAMVDVAAGLGLRTIAEFVESEQTLELLREYGVDFVQGYHVGRPRPLDELLGK
jgi:diguanylate cyclase (GGDEF)-like protein/PAS domain S-box-containing protein